MGLTLLLMPAALGLAALGITMAVSGFRQRDFRKLLSAAAVFALLAAGAGVMMEFITRPLGPV